MIRKPLSRLVLLASLLAAACAAAPAAIAEEPPAEYVLHEALVIESIGRYGRTALHLDPIEAQIVAGTWMPPDAGDEVMRHDGEKRAWTEASVGDNGWLRGPALRGGYVYWSIDVPSERVMILQAAGHSLVYANGALRTGDVYSTGWGMLPVKLNAGRNDFLFRVSRGRMRAKLTTPKAGAFFNLRDRTMPDLIVGEDWPVRGGVIVVNATDEAMEDLAITSGGGGLPMRIMEVPAIAPMTTRKVPIWLGGPLPPDTRNATLTLELSRTVDGVKRVIDTATTGVGVREPSQRQKRTFISAIDGSVQYYAVTPRKETDDDSPPALFLTCHGAGVEAAGQAAVYAPKEAGHVVAPTNRRPYGFDWEDWGRMDAVEVLELNQARLDIDPNRTYLTGHSMGGHGAWQVGVTLPDRFAAIGPSAGWVSFWSYVGTDRFENASPIERLLRRATNPGDTVALSRNYLHYGIYILHGGADDNVPATEAQFMNEHLAGFHHDFTYHEEPGAGHWWGNRCCDWPAMFEFFDQRTRSTSAEIDSIEFHTASPGVSAFSHWVGIQQQIEHLDFSAVTAQRDKLHSRFNITTKNVARLALKLDDLAGDGPIDVKIDGQRLADIPRPEEANELWLVRTNGDDASWTTTDEPLAADQKGPHRYGPFKDAFRHRMLFVYGTQGEEAENRWAHDKARYDAETWWYRGNGAVDVIPDTAFDDKATRDRGVILYGNADTNAAWSTLLADSPVQVKRGAVSIGDRTIEGDDLGCLFLRPRPGSDIACVGVVTGTGPGGMGLTDRLPYFMAGVGYPDCFVIDSSVLTDGVAGVRAAGYFGADWTLESGQFAWDDEQD